MLPNESLFPSREYILAYAESYPERRVKVVEADGGITFAFETDACVATSILPMTPYLGNGSSREGAKLLRRLGRELRVSHVVFRLVYRDTPGVETLSSNEDVAVFARRPSPIIDWRAHGDDMEFRLETRLGRQYSRRRRSFQRRGLTVKAVDDWRAALEIVRDVEKCSWKAACEQDMFSRRQFTFYAELLRRGVLKATAVLDSTQPVAYRLDGFTSTSVVCVKWSFHARYASVSPGFYLIACDLPQRYSEYSISHIDLFGGEDILKRAVMTDCLARVDVVYPGDARAEKLVREGLRLDKQLATHLESGRGLRRFYQEGRGSR